MSRPFGLKKRHTHTNTRTSTQSMWGRVYWKRAGATWPYLWSWLQLQLQLGLQQQLLWPPAAAWCAHFSINCLVGCMQAESLPRHRHQHRHQQQPQQQQQHDVILQLSVIYKRGVQQRAPLSSPFPALGVAARCFASCCYQSANKLSCIGTALDSSLPSLPPNCPSVACLRLPPLLRNALPKRFLNNCQATPVAWFCKRKK